MASPFDRCLEAGLTASHRLVLGRPLPRVHDCFEQGRQNLAGYPRV